MKDLLRFELSLIALNTLFGSDCDSSWHRSPISLASVYWLSLSILFTEILTHSKCVINDCLIWVILYSSLYSWEVLVTISWRQISALNPNTFVNFIVYSLPVASEEAWDFVFLLKLWAIMNWSICSTKDLHYSSSTKSYS